MHSHARWTMVLALAIAGGAMAHPRSAAGQDEPKADQPAAGALPGPPPLENVSLLPTLPTVPIRRGSPAFNVHSVDASLLPRDKQGIWVLDFSFKPLRIVTAEIPGKGRRQVYYLVYRVINRTGQPRDFVPQFILETETGKRYEESVLPKVVKNVQAREDPSVDLLGAVDIAGVIPASTKEGVDDAVYGVAMWDSIDPRADRLKIYVRGLSDGYKETTAADGGKTSVKYKTLRIDLIRRGDHINVSEKEIELAEPPYEWLYW